MYAWVDSQVKAFFMLIYISDFFPFLFIGFFFSSKFIFMGFLEIHTDNLVVI